VWKKALLSLAVLIMAVRTLTFTPGASVIREAETETTIAGNTGFSHNFGSSPRPYYRFGLQVLLTKTEAECLSALHAFHQGHKSFFYNGGAYGSIDDYNFVNEADGVRKDFLLANRYVGANSIAVRTLRPSTGATSNTTAYSLNASPGLITFNTAPASGDYVQAKYANVYRCNFSPEGLQLDQIATDIYTAQFDLIENPIVTPDVPIVARQVFYQQTLAVAHRGTANITRVTSARQVYQVTMAAVDRTVAAINIKGVTRKALAATAQFAASIGTANTPGSAAAAMHGTMAVTSGATTAVISTGLSNSAYVTLTTNWNTTWRVTSRGATNASVAFGTQVGSGGGMINWGTF
jgi:hypothetical protein